MFEFKDGDIVIKNKDFVILTGVDKARQDIVEILHLITGSYSIRKTLGTEWLDYIGNLSIEEQDDFIMTDMRNRILNYPGVIAESVEISIEKKENRKAYFKITLNWNNEEINIDYDETIKGG